VAALRKAFMDTFATPRSLPKPHACSSISTRLGDEVQAEVASASPRRVHIVKTAPGRR
jgi:hypothetical protein